jgi:hypothetical protein
VVDGEKVCAKCKEPKPATEFGRDVTHHDGLKSHCKSCRKETRDNAEARGRAMQGVSPAHDLNHQLPDGYILRGASTLYDADGKVRQQWVKSQLSPTAMREYLDALIAGLKDQVDPVAPVAAPDAANDDLASLYVITDYHLGMLAWGEETGADWDLKIAEDLLVRWFAAAIAASPPSTMGILAQLGDFLHFDGLRTVTPTSGHVLDADSRFTKLVRVAIRVLRRIVSMLLVKHREVRILMEEGNHDEASSVWLRELLAALYDQEPRVHVDTRPDPYHLVRWGKTFLGFHHGHKRKTDSVDAVLVSKFREAYGETTHHYAHTGHLHHNEVRESNLMTVEQHRTLAAPDAYAARGGWLSGREAKVIIYHRAHGEVGRTTINPGMLGAEVDS